ncbi:aliphatic sulfonate ABC transporter ATP-binding protein [Bacillus methanolicus]|uniref:ABC transporter ATP-binding protein n=1 Tax=Bacillus methanolicus TaxID=1471 RepID=UPI00238021FA|nr:ATP-binding cassette domain-containing protein [Bacillus methanolicus]MDE3838955.1 aliphatic sulfonate ABC transporter ATP-binding protein [Bacillus methanolicus]
MTGIYVKVEDVHKRFGSLEVINGLNLEIKPGEFLAIVGRSGCGKSTLLRLISGLEDPTAGKILFNEKAIKGIHPDLRIMFQDARLLPWQTVIQNVELGTKFTSKKKAEESLKLVGLAEKSNEWPSVLSGGQRQRVALARALAGEPKLLLLDEPLGALDALTRIEMQQLIEELWLKQRFTAILVTHDVSEAITLADRVVLIEKGKITMNVVIELSRPRVKDSKFASYERMILEKLMGKKSSNIELQNAASTK